MLRVAFLGALSSSFADRVRAHLTVPCDNTTLATLGTPHDVTLQEIRIGVLLPRRRGERVRLPERDTSAERRGVLSR